ncbi:uncharacterized protein LOC126235487 [Schistocerca nitens]|uniref:uncharacterized protein LOC126235487 n=1 Tax=Schistocerca nitens TaxID=7011 RepID=UPI0021190623|nr:uncharacterized protein LOC126235487 [Schistocerca nitens]
MIDWVSIVRHSRRRFSNYMYAVPSKVRKRRRMRRSGPQEGSPGASAFSCGCCWPQKKTRYGAEDQLPPPPSPPQLKELSSLDGVPRPTPTDRLHSGDGVVLRDAALHQIWG